MGADDAILISDKGLEHLDTQGAARVLAAAINKIGGVDMVMFGRQTLDDGSGLTAAQTARVLGWPMLGFVGHIELDGGASKLSRVIEEGRQNVKAPLPAVLSIVQSIGEPRYPSFMGIRKASKAAIPVWSAGGPRDQRAACPGEPHRADHAPSARGSLRDHHGRFARQPLQNRWSTKSWRRKCYEDPCLH